MNILRKIFIKLYYNIYFIILKIKYKDSFVYSEFSFGKGFSLDIIASNFKMNLNNVKFKNYCSVNIRDGGEVSIGKGVSFNSFSSINCLKKITIGDDTIFGSNVNIYDHNHSYTNNELLIKQQGYSKEEVVIGNNCWISSNVTILKGVKIGDNVVIGAGLIVFKDVQSNSVLINNQNVLIK